MTADVAVVVAARNEAALIGRAVRSALRQARAAEVVVVDDASTDGTGDAAAACGDGTGRLRVLRLALNAGPAAARNHAVARSSAPLVCTLDADDYMQDGRLDALLAQAGEDWDFVADDLLTAREAAPEAITGRLGIAAATPVLTLGRFLEADLTPAARGGAELGFLKPVMRRAFLARAGLAYDPALRLGEDFTLYAEALAHGARWKLVPACGYVAVQRAGSLSASHCGADLAALAASDDRLLALPMLGAAEAALLRRHRDRLRNRAHHHAMLDAKRAGRWAATFGQLLRRPAATAYILRETLRLKVAAHGER